MHDRADKIHPHHGNRDLVGGAFISAYVLFAAPLY
jgi:hypothetical protein